MKTILFVFLLSFKLVQLMGHYYTDEFVFDGYVVGDTQPLEGVLSYEEKVLLRVPEEYRYFFIDFPYEYDWTYLAAMAHVESRFTANAVSPENWNGSRDEGLMQINNRYTKYFVYLYGFEYFDPYNGHHSIQLAAAHLDNLVQKTDNIEDAVVAYNIGLSSFRQGKRIHSGNLYLQKVRSFR